MQRDAAVSVGRPRIKRRKRIIQGAIGPKARQARPPEAVHVLEIPGHQQSAHAIHCQGHHLIVQWLRVQECRFERAIRAQAGQVWAELPVNVGESPRQHGAAIGQRKDGLDRAIQVHYEIGVWRASRARRSVGKGHDHVRQVPKAGAVISLGQLHLEGLRPLREVVTVKRNCDELAAFTWGEPQRAADRFVIRTCLRRAVARGEGDALFHVCPAVTHHRNNCA